MSSAGENEVEPRKLFVGGLSWDTKKDGLKKYFETFGEVTDSVIMIDPVTEQPRGFGFVTFADPDVAAGVLRKKECGEDFIIDNKKVEPKRATVKPPLPKKIFLGGIRTDTTDEDIKKYFGENYVTYGPDGRQEAVVTEVDLKYDKTTQKMKGFGFVTFASHDVYKQVCEKRHHVINDKQVEAKESKPPARGQYTPRPGGFGGGMYNGAMYPSAGQPYQQGQYPQQYEGYGYSAGYGGAYGGAHAGGYGGAASYSYPQSGTQQPVNSYQDQSYGASGYNTSRTDTASYSQQQYPGYQQQQQQQQGYTNTAGNTGYGRTQGQQQQHSGYGAYPSVH